MSQRWLLSATQLLKNNCLVPIKKNAALKVPSHRPRKHNLFQIAALLHQIFQRVAMRNARNSLFDDGSVIQNFGNVVSRRTDQLDSSIVSLLVRFRPDERRQESNDGC